MPRPLMGVTSRPDTPSVLRSRGSGQMSYKVRVAPLDPQDFTPEQAELVGNWQHLVFSRVIVNSPKMYRTFLPHIHAAIAQTSLPPRERQILVLRSLASSRDIYELAHHVTISRNAGISEADIAAFQSGDGASLSEFDRALIAAADELRLDQFVSDATWEKLAARYSTEQLMDVVFVTGLYLTMAMLTKSFGMELERDEGQASEVNKLRNYV
ncbi:MAG: carboxymuconolactone decarboxylase family protein [Zymomonas sp.]|nr:MAG: carboxymuconolactone decarboxylase family protein [Zymomonas sp.]